MSCYTNEEISIAREAMRNVQTAKRYEHTLGVAYTAGAMAMCWGEEVSRAVMAGMLHDCAKNLDEKNMICACKKAGIELSPVELVNPQLIHQHYGAYLAYKKYHITDKEVISSIRYHTTGKENMTLLEKIVYIADFIEPGRHVAAGLDEFRKLAFADIDKCMYCILEDTLEYLDRVGKPAEPETMSAYLFYKELVN